MNDDPRNHGTRRREGDGLIVESATRWGHDGSTTYLVLYLTDGRIRIDLIGHGAGESGLRAVWLTAREVRPRSEWLAHLDSLTVRPVEARWCAADGMEIPSDRLERETPEDPELFCSIDCTSASREPW